MKYAVFIIAFFSFVLSANAQTETLFLQQFTLVDGSVFHAKISTTSLKYLYEKNQSPDYVWQNFGNLWSIVKVSALFWEAKEVKADELSLKEAINHFIEAMSDKMGISSDRVKRIIQCESGYNPKAYNPKDIDGRPKFGILQFDSRTFTGTDIWDWQQQIKQGTKMMADGGWRHWPTCSRG